jgi:hypothetical protein
MMNTRTRLSLSEMEARIDYLLNDDADGDAKADLILKIIEQLPASVHDSYSVVVTDLHPPRVVFTSRFGVEWPAELEADGKLPDTTISWLCV